MGKKSVLVLLVLFHVCAVSVFAAEESDTSKTFETTKEKISYSVGYFYYNAIQDQGYEMDDNAFLQGIKDSAADSPVMTEEERQTALNQYKSMIQQQQAEERQQLLAKNKAAGADFLEANKEKEGVKTLEDGLQYKVMTKGDGESPTAEDTIKCHYKGYTIDGKVFDSSYQRGEPAVFKLDGVIEGWTQAIQKMKTGGKWQLFVPPDLAYGDRGAGNAIEPGSTLIFEVELLSIEEEGAESS